MKWLLSPSLFLLISCESWSNYELPEQSELVYDEYICDEAGFLRGVRNGIAEYVVPLTMCDNEDKIH